MKRALFYMAALILLSACQQEELAPQEEALGYLSIENLSVEVENLDYVFTRAVDTDFYVKIEGNGEPKTYEPGKVPSEIALEAGNYTVSVYNYEAYQEGQPLYSKDTTITITANNVNHISMQVPLKNVGVRLNLPDNFEDYFTYVFLISQNSQSGYLQNSETYYFESSSNGAIIYSMTVTNKDDEMSPTIGTISNPQNGNIYVVTYDYATRTLVLQP